MSQVYCIRSRRKGKHLTFEERDVNSGFKLVLSRVS